MNKLLSVLDFSYYSVLGLVLRVESKNARVSIVVYLKLRAYDC